MRKVIFLRTTFFIIVFASIFLIYYTKVVQKDYHTFTNEEGPDTSDYFLIDLPYAEND